MSKLTCGTIITDLDNNADNLRLLIEGYTVRHIETYHSHDGHFIVWDVPAFCEADLPY